MGYRVKITGPMFSDVALARMDAAQQEAKAALGVQALADWHHNLNVSIKHPTPYYETQLQVGVRGSQVVVDDRQIVYGPWLEGVGSRNQTSRFKGYFAMRKAAQAVRARAGDIVAPIMRLFAESMT